MQALKIAVIGPRGSGKTYISDHVSGQPAADIPPSYDPTVGVRILPFIHESAVRVPIIPPYFLSTLVALSRHDQLIHLFHFNL